MKLSRFSWMLVAQIAACTAPLLEEPDGSVGRAGASAARDAASGSRPARAVGEPPARDAGADAGSPRTAGPSDASAPTPPSSAPTTSTSDAGRTATGDEDAGATSEPIPATTEIPVPKPVHRYDFSGSGARVMDAVGDAHGLLLGGAELAGGAVELDGIDDCVRLPPGLVSTQSSVTLLAWLRWDGGECWQRLFDFGTRMTTGRADRVEERVPSSLFLTLSRCPSNTPAVGYVDDEGSEHTAAADPLPGRGMMQLGVTFDGPSQRLRLIVEGVVVAEQTSRLQLAELDDLVAWLGRSQHSHDPLLSGQLTEFRIYDQALEPEVIAATFARGPDAL